MATYPCLASEVWSPVTRVEVRGEAAMGCSCSDHTEEYAQKVNDLLESVGLKEVVEQGREAITEAGRALVHLNRAERAKSLGFGSEIASIHSDAATRSNQRAQEQVQTVLARIDHVLRGDDWSGHVERVRAAFRERGGAKKLKGLRADIRLQLLDDDPGISATLAELSLVALDSAINAASEGDLDQVAGHMRGIMDYALRGFESPEMGRQPIGLGLFDDERSDSGSPPIGGGADAGWCVALAACLAWAWSSLIASLIVCFAVPFCWCCFHMFALGTFALHQIACIAALGPACGRPG
jgi:hypothetical protein